MRVPITSAMLLGFWGVYPEEILDNRHAFERRDNRQTNRIANGSISGAPRSHRLISVSNPCRVGLLLIILAAALAIDAAATAAQITDFSVSDQHGQIRELYQLKNARAVVLIFTMNGCPIIEKSIPKIKQLRDRFGSKGVVFWLIDSNPDDTAAEVRKEAGEFAIDLPIVIDRSQAIARSLKATRTAEAFCLQPRSWTVFYHGAIDDQFGYGTEKRQAAHPYLANALASFLAGKSIAPAETDVRGCRIQLAPK